MKLVIPPGTIKDGEVFGHSHPMHPCPERLTFPEFSAQSGSGVLDLTTFEGVFDRESSLAAGMTSVGVVVNSAQQTIVSCLVGEGEPAQLTVDLSAAGWNEWWSWISATQPSGSTAMLFGDRVFHSMLGIRATFAVESMRPMPISPGMVSAYKEVIDGKPPTDLEVAEFMALLGRRPLTYRFLTSWGLPPSARDISHFLESRTSVTYVMSPLEGGWTEIFYLTRGTGDRMWLLEHLRLLLLGKMRPPPAADLALAYFRTERKYRILPDVWRYRLAVMAVCRKYELGLSYSVHAPARRSSDAEDQREGTQ